MSNRLAAAAVLAVTAALGGCVTPALDTGAFTENARAAVESGLSATATAHLALDARLAGRATKPLADVVVSESEQAIDPVERSFGGVDPPSQQDDDLRTAVLDALGQAGDALADARIAVRRDDDDGMRSAAADLDKASGALQALQEKLP